MGRRDGKRDSGKANSQSNRQARWQPRANAAADAEHESGKARRRPRTDVPASAEVRERCQSNCREPAAADVQHPAGPHAVLL